MLQTLFVMLSLILLSSICGHGQGYEVLDAKRCYYQSGRKIKIGDILNQKEIVHVKKNGYMTIDVQSPRNLKLSEGWHNIDSLLAVLTVKYDRHISWSNFLKQKGLLGCKFAYKTWIVPGSNRHYEADRIVVPGKGIMSVNGDSLEPINLKWSNPDDSYQGSYFVIVREAFNKGFFVDILETDSNSIPFYPAKYGYQYLFYTIMAEDCRASKLQKIEIKR